MQNGEMPQGHPWVGHSIHCPEISSRTELTVAHGVTYFLAPPAGLLPYQLPDSSPPALGLPGATSWTPIALKSSSWGLLSGEYK